MLKVEIVKNSFYIPSTQTLKKWGVVIILLLLVASGVMLMSRSRESGHSYITNQVKIEVQATGKDPCDILSEWLAEAKREKDTQLARKIKQAQKSFACRNRQKRQGG
ncbi:hypothetical protein QUF64_12825 [Anaerolineales bacterium HSG6]|nr:hypothetical protein [Anaerolineales bacterium HSG6]